MMTKPTMSEAWCKLSRDMRRFRDDVFAALRLPDFVEWLSRKLARAPNPPWAGGTYSWLDWLALSAFLVYLGFVGWLIVSQGGWYAVALLLISAG